MLSCSVRSNVCTYWSSVEKKWSRIPVVSLTSPSAICWDTIFTRDYLKPCVTHDTYYALYRNNTIRWSIEAVPLLPESSAHCDSGNLKVDKNVWVMNHMICGDKIFRRRRDIFRLKIMMHWERSFSVEYQCCRDFSWDGAKKLWTVVSKVYLPNAIYWDILSHLFPFSSCLTCATCNL